MKRTWCTLRVVVLVLGVGGSGGGRSGGGGGSFGVVDGVGGRW